MIGSSRCDSGSSYDILDNPAFLVDDPGSSCGNGRCEYGEECKDGTCSSGCASNCPRYSPTCPFGVDTLGRNATCSGRGSCIFGSSLCLCYAGNVGANCGLCAASYTGIRLTANGPCVYLPGSELSCHDGVKNGNEDGVDCGGPNCDEICVGSDIGPWYANVSAMIGLCMGSAVAAVVVTLYLFFRRLKAKVKPVQTCGRSGVRAGLVSPFSVRTGRMKPLQLHSKVVVIGSPRPLAKQASVMVGTRSLRLGVL
jgi:hypothetical protein